MNVQKKRLKSLLCGLLCIGVLMSQTPMVFAANTDGSVGDGLQNLLGILEELYLAQNGDGVTLMSEGDEGDSSDITVPVIVKTDDTNEAEITLGSATAEDGTVAVPIYVTAPAGLNGVQMTVTYGEGLTCAECSVDENMWQYSSITPAANAANTLSLVFANENNVTGAAENFLLTTLTFTVDGDAEPGAEISVSGEVTYVTYRKDSAEDNTIYTMVYGTVNVKDSAVTLPGGLEITVTNKTSATAPAVVTAPESGWVEGENTFTVSHDVACVVAVSNDGGENYTPLTAAVTDTENTCSFTANITKDSEIVVMVKGDADQNGLVNAVDVLQLQLDVLSSGNANYSELPELGKIACDINGDSFRDVTDVLWLQLGTLAATNPNYVALTW